MGTLRVPAGVSDKPRVRGEHKKQMNKAAWATGSAPRARGTPPARADSSSIERISPACAGNTFALPEPLCQVADQPRVRGEHHPLQGHALRVVGSAPRARGTLPWSAAPPVLRRISPACAGNTGEEHHEHSPLTNQPRVRGEHGGHRVARPDYYGSAPRARGTPFDGAVVFCTNRISPACAGNTLSRPTESNRQSDQPRVRGEHTFELLQDQAVAGSAPRARGTRAGRVPGRAGSGISPACAGNTMNQGTWARRPTDQPRVRGEHTRDLTGTRLAGGSAPRARGTRLPVPQVPRAARISPACAGNTRRRCGARRPPPDQPRVRGEHL